MKGGAAHERLAEALESLAEDLRDLDSCGNQCLLASPTGFVLVRGECIHMELLNAVRSAINSGEFMREEEAQKDKVRP